MILLMCIVQTVSKKFLFVSVANVTQDATWRESTANTETDIMRE